MILIVVNDSNSNLMTIGKYTENEKEFRKLLYRNLKQLNRELSFIQQKSHG